jgi:hypothetical protein
MNSEEKGIIETGFYECLSAVARPKESPVFAIELRRTFVANEGACSRSTHVLIQHELLRLLQTKQFLKLHGANSGDRPKMLPERGRTHVGAFGQIFHSHPFGEMLPDPCHRSSKLLCRTSGIDEAPQVRRVRTRQQANDEFLLYQRRKLRNQHRLVEQRDEPMKSIKHRRIQPLYPYWLKGCCLTRPYRLDFGRNLER